MGALFGGAFAAVLAVLLVAGAMVGCPQYNVYEQRKSGEAELAKAESNRQIKVREADAKFQSATKLAAADTLRAWGVRRSNEIIAEGLGGPQGYLEYLKIQALEANSENGKIIYIPTEAMLPVTESGKR